MTCTVLYSDIYIYAYNTIGRYILLYNIIADNMKMIYFFFNTPLDVPSLLLSLQHFLVHLDVLLLV